MAEQQIIQNPSVTPGALKIELSGGYVTAISGHPVGGTGGGGGPSVVYTGVVGEINVNNQQGTIGLDDEVKEQLSSIPTKVSDLSDSANYYTTEQVDSKFTNLDYTQIVGLDAELNSKQNKLTFGYDDSAISSINGSAIAGQNDMSQYALKNDLDVVSGEVDILTDTSAKWNEVSAKFDTSSWNAYSGKFQLSGDYATKSDLDLYYEKTETSSKDEISDAIKDFITDADVTAKNYLTEASGNLLYVPIPAGLSEGQYYAMTTSSWKVIQGAGDVSGISTVAHDDTLTGNGNNENLGIAQTATMNLTNTSAKSAVSAEWAQKAKGVHTDYVIGTELDSLAGFRQNIINWTDRIDGENGIEALDLDNDGYIETFKLTDSAYAAVQYVTSNSGDWDNVSAKLDTTAAAQTYQTKGDYVKNTDINLDANNKVTAISGKQLIITAHQSLTNYYTKSETSGATEISTALGNKVDKPSSTLQNKYLVLRTTSAGSVDGWVDFNDNVYSKTESDGRYQKKNEMGSYLTTAQYSTDSATFVTSSNAVITGTKQYALTSAGWAEVQVPPTFTGVTTDDTLTGAGTDGSDKLGVAWSALSSNKIDSAKSAEYITNGVGYSGFDDISSKFDSLTSYVPYSATVLPIGTNNTATNNSIAIGSNNTANDLGFAVGQSNTALKRSIAFGVNNYANDISLAIGYGNSASGNNDNNQSAVNIAIGYANSAADHAAALINVCTAENYAFAAGHANSAIDNSVAFGRSTSAYFYSFDFGHSNNVKYYSYAFGRGLHYEGQWAGQAQYGAFVIGGWNATTSYATTADAPLFIIGNGTNNSPSDGFVVYRDGDVSAAGTISANSMFAVASAASLIGASRQTSSHYGVDNAAIGTTWVGVGSNGMHQGFIKYTDGGDVGALDSNSMIQLNFKPSTNNYDSIQVQINNNHVGYLIPAVTATTTAGLTDDGILHIIIES